MLAGVLACTVESISYYPTVAQMCAAPPPPLHAINRGIGTEGLGTVLAGLWGSGNGTNTFGENVGAIGVTKVSSYTISICVSVNRFASIDWKSSCDTMGSLYNGTPRRNRQVRRTVHHDSRSSRWWNFLCHVWDDHSLW